MCYQEKRTVMNLLNGIVFLAVYCVYAWSKYQSGVIEPGDLKSWALIMLVFIGIGIVATIIMQILFQIFIAISIAIEERTEDEKKINKTIAANMVEDEMDKLIELKSSKVSFIFAGIGFFAGLIALVFNVPEVIVLNCMFLSFAAGSLLEGIYSMYLYRNGVKNGW
ncbi:MAG: hypothetical protein A2015_09555 [Spirochaetes bacterium GWF1_31_7]|nr:MAG: hypothetical protein A2Y30_01245 [Spirochaetes bacterium GWE1_32_154]OHD45098.1 MAG: hypothetical protein A2Y29_15290 [Spirochaetes bacterium GWE2_31_10]OHD52665.1 MAG: hypothetical protein A2015_09555 [Spirochaetes bacterium GWF1_31_7]OHD75873.1 MAG: hypothetical protein A2355_04160 [Spirochaetes bacterium RIFOXYB1_FULL_32_8]HBD95227.1 hypothetical protein [Spirochaetia bacterium]